MGGRTGGRQEEFTEGFGFVNLDKAVLGRSKGKRWLISPYLPRECQ